MNTISLLCSAVGINEIADARKQAILKRICIIYASGNKQAKGMLSSFLKVIDEDTTLDQINVVVTAAEKYLA